MTRRKPSEYDWSKLQFDETILTKHFTAPRRQKIQFVVAHHMIVLDKDINTDDALDACWDIWQKREASAHYGVDGKFIRQYVWDGNAAWATANSSGNHSGISIEHANITLDQTGTKNDYKVSETTWKNGAKLAAHLHKVYKLGRPTSTGFGTGGTLRTHQSFFATACPGPFFREIWTDYVKEAQRVYDEITKTTPPRPKPKTQTVRWHSTAFLNIWGDDGGKGQASVKERLPKMIADVTQGRPEVVGLCEVRKEQEPAVTKAMKAVGYELAGYSHRLAFYVLPSVEVAKVDFYQYSKQNAGAIEGILRGRFKIGGSWVHYGLTHLDYRDGFDAGRVTQMKHGITGMRLFALRYVLPSWKSRTIIPGDLNSENWVIAKALVPSGFKAAVRAAIDSISVGKERPVLDSDTRKTKSDHPIVEATFGKTVKI